MRYSCQAEAEMAHARFAPYGSPAMLPVIDSTDGEYVDAFDDFDPHCQCGRYHRFCPVHD